MSEDNQVKDALEAFKETAMRGNAAIIKEMLVAYPELVPHLNQLSWIPCSERLPDKSGTYLISISDSYHDALDVLIADFDIEYTGRFVANCDYDLGRDREPDIFYVGKNVVAWQPVPAPYEGE